MLTPKNAERRRKFSVTKKKDGRARTDQRKRTHQNSVNFSINKYHVEILTLVIQIVSNMENSPCF